MTTRGGGRGAPDIVITTALQSQVEPELRRIEAELDRFIRGIRRRNGQLRTGLSGLDQSAQSARSNLDNIFTSIRTGTRAASSDFSRLDASLVEIESRLGRLGRSGLGSIRRGFEGDLPDLEGARANFERQFEEVAGRPPRAGAIGAQAPDVDVQRRNAVQAERLARQQATAAGSQQRTVAGIRARIQAIEEEEAVMGRSTSTINRRITQLRRLIVESNRGNQAVRESVPILTAEIEALQQESNVLKQDAQATREAASATQQLNRQRTSAIGSQGTRAQAIYASIAAIEQEEAVNGRTENTIRRLINAHRQLLVQRELGNQAVRESTTELTTNISQLESEAASMERFGFGLNQRTRGMARAFNIVSSSAQGAVLGMAAANTIMRVMQDPAKALEGDILGLAFSLIFLQFAMGSIAIPIALVTAGIGIMLRRLQETRRTTRAIQALALNLRITGSSADFTSEAILRATELVNDFGFTADDATKAIATLAGNQLDLGDNLDLIAQLAAGTNNSLSDTVDAIVALIRPSEFTVGNFEEFRDALNALIPAAIRSEGGLVDLIQADAELFGQIAGIIDPQERLNALMDAATEIWPELSSITGVLVDDQGALTDSGEELFGIFTDGQEAVAQLADTLGTGTQAIDTATEAVRIFIEEFENTGSIEAARDAVEEFFMQEGIDPNLIPQAIREAESAAKLAAPGIQQAINDAVRLTGQANPAVIRGLFDEQTALNSLSVIEANLREQPVGITGKLSAEGILDEIIRQVATGEMDVATALDVAASNKRVLLLLSEHKGLLGNFIRVAIRSSEEAGQPLTLDKLMNALVSGGLDDDLIIKAIMRIHKVDITDEGEVEAKTLGELIADAMQEGFLTALQGLQSTPGLAGAIANLGGAAGQSGQPSSQSIPERIEEILRLWPFQHGGIVTGPTAALVGEAGPEAIIPLDRLEGPRTTNDIDDLVGKVGDTEESIFVTGQQTANHLANLMVGNQLGFIDTIGVLGAGFARVEAGSGMTATTVSESTQDQTDTQVEKFDALKEASDVLAELNAGQITLLEAMVQLMQPRSGGGGGSTPERGSVADILTRNDPEAVQDALNNPVSGEDIERIRNEIESGERDPNDNDYDDIVGLQRGGIVRRRTLALLAENNRPEAVVPLDKGFGNNNITIVVQGNMVGNDEFLADMSRTILRSMNLDITARGV